MNQLSLVHTQQCTEEELYECEKWLAPGAETTLYLDPVLSYVVFQLCLYQDNGSPHCLASPEALVTVSELNKPETLKP